MVNKFMSIVYLEPFYGNQENRLNFKDENGDVLLEASNLMQIWLINVKPFFKDKVLFRIEF